MTADRYVLAGAIVVAAISIETWSGTRAFAYVAGALGVFAVHERLRAEFAPAVATLASLLILGATSLFWFMTRAPGIGDALAFAVAAGGMWWLSREHSPTTRSIAALVTAALSVAAWYAAARAVPVDNSASATVTDLLFSSSAGWFSLTPVAYLAAIGLVPYFKRNSALALTAITILAAWLLVLRLLPPGNPHEPFGNGLTMALAVVAPGLATVIEYARARPLVAALPLIAGAVLWNYWLMVQYTVGLLPKDEPVSFAAMVRQQADVHTRSPYVYPFAMPANVLFAWREGVPAERFEVLSREPRRAEFDLVMDRAADRFLLEGWGGPATTPMGAVRWTAARRSTLVAPLALPQTGGTFSLTLAARSEEPAVSVDLSLELNGVEVQRFAIGPEATEKSFSVPVTGVGAVLRAGYNRLTLINHGIHRLDAADQRPLGPLAARSATAPYPVALHRLRFAPAS